MISSFSDVLMIVKNRGEPPFRCGNFERNRDNLMSFETRITAIREKFLQILEIKL